MKFKFLVRFFLRLILVFATSCSQGLTEADLYSKQVTDSLSCSNLHNKIFDSIYDYTGAKNKIPTIEEFSISIQHQIENLDQQKIEQNKKTLNLIEKRLVTIYSNLLKNKYKNPEQFLEKMIEYQLDANRSNDQSAELDLQTHSINKLARSINIDCNNQDNSGSENQTNDPNNTDSNQVEKNISSAIKKVFSTAYQSCHVFNVPLISKFTPNVVGINDKQTNPNNNGKLRFIEDLKSVQQTHPYIRVSGQSTQNGCFNVFNNPLIYDYGGKPNVSRKKEINFFVNAGDGGKTLGIDCSGYVSSIIAIAGLRFNKNLPLRSEFTLQHSSKFISASKSNWSCFRNVTLNQNSSIKVGDILGYNGHVIMIDSVSDDPFGFQKLSSIKECSGLSTDNFNFSITQSSPSKRGLGINRYLVKDYLKEVGSQNIIYQAFQKIALDSCKAYFNHEDIATPSDKWGLIRHLGSPECLDTPLTLSGESCVQECTDN